MIQKLEIGGQQIEVTPKLHKYVMQKIGKLDKYIPRAARESAHADVIVKAAKSNGQPVFSANVTLHLPQQTLDAHEQTVNVFAAIDIVEEKLRAQLRTYKELHSADAKRRLFARNAAKRIK